MALSRDRGGALVLAMVPRPLLGRVAGPLDDGLFCLRMCCSPFCEQVVCLLVDLFCSSYWVVLEFGLGSLLASCGGSSSVKCSGPFGLPARTPNNGKFLRVSFRDGLDNNVADDLVGDGIRLLVGSSGWICS